jgi:hypothetical protein
MATKSLALVRASYPLRKNVPKPACVETGIESRQQT